MAVCNNTQHNQCRREVTDNKFNKQCLNGFDRRNVPVDAVVAVVVTVLTVLSVGVVGIDGVDCDSVVKVVGIVALSTMPTEYYLGYSQKCFLTTILSSREVPEPSFIQLILVAVCNRTQHNQCRREVTDNNFNKQCRNGFDRRKVPVDAVVAVVVTVLTALSVGVVGVDAVDCDSVVKVVGVVALSTMPTEYYLGYSQKCFLTTVLSSREVPEPSFIQLILVAVCNRTQHSQCREVTDNNFNKQCLNGFDGRKVPVDAVVAVVVTVLTVLSVGVVGIDGVDCDSVLKVVGVVALSKMHTQYHLQYSQRCIVSFVCLRTQLKSHPSYG